MIYSVNNSREVWDLLNAPQMVPHDVQHEGVHRMNIEVATEHEAQFVELMATVDSNLKEA